MKKFEEIETVIVEKKISQAFCNKCGSEVFHHANYMYHDNENRSYTEKRHLDYQNLPYHALTVKVRAGYSNKLLSDLSIFFFDLCEQCLLDFMNSFKIKATEGDYSPLPFDTDSKEEDL